MVQQVGHKSTFGLPAKTFSCFTRAPSIDATLSSDYSTYGSLHSFAVYAADLISWKHCLFARDRSAVGRQKCFALLGRENLPKPLNLRHSIHELSCRSCRVVEFDMLVREDYIRLLNSEHDQFFRCLSDYLSATQ